MKKLLILAFALLTLAAQGQNQYYVAATGGSDSNSGTSSGSPWATCNHAIATVGFTGPGAVINFLPSTTAHAACTFGRGGSSISSRMMLRCTVPFTNATHCRMAGHFTVNANANNIDIGAIGLMGFEYTNASDDVAVDVVWAGGSGTTSSGGNGIHVLGNDFHDIGQNVSGPEGPGCPEAGVILIPNAHGKVQTDVQVNGNLIDHYGTYPNSACNESNGVYVSTSNAQVYNNLITRIPAGLTIYDQACGQRVSGNVIANNGIGLTIYGGNGCSPVGNNTVSNNAIVNNSYAYDISFGGDGSCSSGHPILFTNNDLFGNSNTFSSTPGACSQNQNQKTENPTTSFVSYTGNAQTSNFNLQSGSILKGGGTSSGVSGGTAPFVPSTDILGNVRPASGAQDIGAYVATSASAPAVSLTPSPLAYGNVAVSSSSTLNATLANTGSANLTFTPATISGTNAADFTISSTTCSSPLTAGSSCSYSIKFTPSAAGARTASLTLNDNASGSPHQLPLTGTGGTGTPVLSPSPVSFPVTAPASCSAQQTITITNTGSTSFSLTGNSTITGTNAGDFKFSFNPAGSCATTTPLAPGASCTTNVAFCPTAVGARTAQFNMFSTAGNPSDTMNGTGGAPSVGVSPSSGSCGSVQVGASVTCQAFTLTNTGNLSLTISGISITGTNASSFSQSNNCPASLAAAANCTITAFFQPTAGGALTGNVSIASNASSSPNLVPLSGIGLTPPTLTLSPTSVNFNNVPVGTTSSATVITLTNAGGSPATISSIVPSSNFGQANNCPASLGAGANCSISVTASPVATGVLNGTLTVTASATGSPFVASLSVTGVTPVVSFTPASIPFGSQPVGSQTAGQSFTLANTGTSALTFTLALGGTNPGDFTLLANSCGTSLQAGQNCSVPVAFKPTTSGARSATVIATSNASSSPDHVSVTGTGIATSPAVCLSASSVNFGNQPVSTSSGSLPVVVTNCGTANLVISGITPTGNFTETDNCATVAPTATCTINGVFTPASAGALTGQFSIASNSASSPDLIALSGFGTQTGATLTPSSISFGHITVGGSSNISNLTLTNTGNTALTLNTPTLTGSNPGDFAFGSSCGSTLAANATCQLAATFFPTTTGARSAILNQSFAGGAATVTSNLTGTGDAPASAVAFTPTSLNFGSVTQGTSSSTLTVQLQNTGTATLNISSVTFTGTNAADYSLNNHCGSAIAVQKICTLDVTVVPGGVGARTANLHFVDDAANSPQDVPLTVNGVASPAPMVSLSPLSLSFSPPSIQTGTTSGAQVITVNNTGNGDLVIDEAVTIGGANPGDFTQASSCTIVAAGTSCAVTVNCVPTAAGSRTAVLSIASNATSSPDTANLSCTGFVGTPNLLLAVSAINFGNQTVGTVSSPLVFTLTNTGLATATGVALSSSGDFAVTNTCGGSIAAGTSCSASVTFSPLILCGQFDPNNPATCVSNVHLGSIAVVSNTSNSPQNIALQGTAVAVPVTGPITVTMTGHVNLSGHVVVH